MVRDEHGKLVAVSWPQALDAAARGLAHAGANTGVLAGGRLTVEDAYAYVKFARMVLGTCGCVRECASGGSRCSPLRLG
ncbi:NADH-quinone oxidoreductase, G subunit NuoG [Mycobacteroides abscessus subsp. abscessus]|nr:NADH-quinone oxidoreductase, G subunit NuoG [Mycobacteroides abscessus subsp. abscessus]